MKKRILASLLAWALLLSLLVAPVGAEAPETGDCPCGCGQTLEQINWKPWDGNTATGHYYLTDDYALDGQKTVNSGSGVALDLRGHHLTTADYSRLFLIYGYLRIFDSVGGGCLSAKTSGAAVGGAFQVYYNNGDCGTLELRNVTLMPHKDNKSAKGGGLIYVGAGCSLKLDSCVLLNGTTTTSGGALHGAASSVMEITNSSIFGCSAEATGGAIFSAGSVTLENVKLWGSTAKNYGGNICQKGGILVAKNCDLAYGACYGTDGTVYGGGNLCSTDRAQVEITDSVIRDGYARYSGGNVFVTTGSQNFVNTTIRGGVSGQYGANLTSFTASAKTTFDNCTISGNVRYGAGTLTLKGATKIGLENNGLDLVGASDTVVVKATGLTDGAEIFVEANDVFTDAGAKAEYFKPAIRTGTITVDANGCLTAKQTSSGELGGYCPHCYDPQNPQRVRWTKFGDETASDAFNADHDLVSGHFFMNTNTAYLYKLPANVDFVLDINGKTMVGGQRLFRTTGANASLSLLDSVGGGKLTGKGVNNDLGGVIISTFDGFRLNIYGGQLAYIKHADKTVTSGGVIGVSGNNVYVGIHGGFIDGSAQQHNAGNYGGTVFFGNVGTVSKVFEMTAGRLIGGKAQYGGNLYLGHYVEASVTGGVLQGGVSTEGGGNLRVNGNAATKRSEISLQDCALLDGSVTGAFGGGNHYLLNANVDLNNCYFAAGTAPTGYGGNLSGGGAAAITAENTVFLSGSATKGGNLYAAATNGEFLLENCSFLCGSATNYGGNIFFNNGFNTLRGGTVALGTTDGSGGNIYTNAGNQATAGQYTKIQDDVLIAGGAAGSKGGNLYTLGVTELTQAQLVSGSAPAGTDIYLFEGAIKTQLTLSSGVSGDIGMGVGASLLTDPVYGGAIGGTVSTGFSAQITLEGDYSAPGILAKNGALYVGGTTVVDEQGGEVWHATNADAVAACKAGEYVKLYTSAPLVLTKDCAVDLNGQSVAVTGSGTFLGIDSSSDGYSNAAGQAVWEDAAAIKTAQRTDAPNGNTYYAVKQGNTVTYHRLNMGISNMVLRPSSVGLYYKAAWKCDDVLAAQIAEYGIAVSLADMPSEDLDRDEDTMRVSSADGSKQCSVLIENIFKDDCAGAENSARGEMPIYATAYIQFKDGATYISDRPGYTDDIAYSLRDFLELADETVQADRITYRQTENQLKAFYETWQQKGTGDWEFQLIKPQVAPQDDDVLKILIIGQSLANDTAWLLHEVLRAEAPEQKILVKNIYRSVGLDEHVRNIKNRAAAYECYSFSDGKSHTASNVVMTDIIMEENWDVISFNDATYPSTQEKEYKDGEHQFMIDHIRSFADPGFKLAYNATWANPTSAELYDPSYRRQPPATFRDTYTRTFGGSRNLYYSMLCDNFNQYIESNDAYDIVFHGGTAIQYASETHGVPEADPNRVYDLYRDYVHLSDFGRLIVAYQLYAQIFEVAELTQVNVEVIPANLRATYREQACGDVLITQQHKDAIIASVNYALKNPNTNPPQTAREPAILEPLN